MKIKQTISVLTQRALLRFSYALHTLMRGKRKFTFSGNSWVVGVEEIASMLERIHSAVPNSVSVLLSPHNWYSFNYTYQRNLLGNPRLDNLYRQLYGPWLLGKLAVVHDGFIYIGSQGFLDEQIDQRNFEFNFLKKKHKRIVCFFTGDDVRSHFLTKDLASKYGHRNLATVREETDEYLSSYAYDQIKKKISTVAETYSDVIFTWPIDQITYTSKKTEPFVYAYPDALFDLNLEKFDNLSPIVIVHAPSHEATKGTSFVREAINRLNEDGYEFEYIELTNVSNSEVISHLRQAHIVLNQFIAYTPGVFGIEAMANTCVMLCSGDRNIETSLPVGANEAWVVTRGEMVYENLKQLLDKPDQLVLQARRGFEWAKKYESQSAAITYLSRLLSSRTKPIDE